jgi:hypothetical protein
MGQVARSWRFVLGWWPVVVVAGLMILLVALLGLMAFIDTAVHETASAAQREFRGDEAEALIQFVQSDQHSLRDRNRAVWALGQLRDPRALDVLKRFYTGEKCQHDKFLCQAELEKAIDLCSGRNRPPAWLAAIGRQLAISPETR